MTLPITGYPYLGPSTDRLPILPAPPSGRTPSPSPSPGWPQHSPGGQPGETQPTAGVGDPRLSAPAAPPALSGWVPTRIYPAVVDTAVAMLHFPELAPLRRWRWWWVADTLIGRHTDADGAAML